MSWEGFDPTTVFHIPKQKPPPELASVEMRVFLSSHPPLGQITQTKSGEVEFHAVLEVDHTRATKPWQVALWHSTGDNAAGWSEMVLSRTEASKEPIKLQLQDTSVARLYFSGKLGSQPSVRFTLKFRDAPDQEWRWIRDVLGMDDGILIARPKPGTGTLVEKPADFMKDLNPTVRVRSAMSQVPRTQIWSFEAVVPGASGDESSFTDITLGLPWGRFLRWFALVRIWAPWIVPRQGREKFSLNEDAIVCSFINPEGKHLVLLAMSGIKDVTNIFRSNDDGYVVLRSRNDRVEEGTAIVVAAVGDEFEAANAAAMYHARSLVSAVKSATGELEQELKTLHDNIKPEWLENWYDGLGFCTWNALGQQLTEQKILHALDTLAHSNIKIVSLIIDDNWQSLDHKGDGQFQFGWKEFEADPEAFPNGLKATIGQIRYKHSNIEHIAVWHALLGYWGGISPEGKIARTYKTLQVARAESKRRNLPLGGGMTVIAKEDVHKFYDDFYRFLVSCGIDGVKTDAQFTIDTWVSASARRDLITTYQDAWNLASLRHFSAKVISCMSQAPPIMFYSQLPHNRPAMLCRNSDDFFPNIPSSHPWHIWANAHNSLLTQHLNILPDWDMFQTVHDYSGFHAAARCVSGGPIYITDVPGSHNIDLIRQMTGTTIRGKTVVFRPSVLGRSIDQYVGYEDDSLLKVGSYHGPSLTGTSILGVFNVSTRSLTEIIPLSRFPGVHDELWYVVRSYSTGRLTQPVKVDSPTALLEVSLDVRGYEILCSYPLSTFSSEKMGQVHTCNLGLLGKMTGAAAVIGSTFQQEENGRVLLETRLKAMGRLGLYVSTLPQMTIKKNFFATIQGQAIPLETVSLCGHDEHIIEFDVEAAWYQLGLRPGWSNELEVKVYFSMD